VGVDAPFTAASVINPAKNAGLFCWILDNHRIANIRQPDIRYISSFVRVCQLSYPVISL